MAEGVKSSQCIQVLKACDPATIRQFEQVAHRQCFKAGETLFMDKASVDMLYFLAEGYAMLYKMNVEGDRKIIFVCGAGEMLNEVILQQPIASVNGEALTECGVLSIARSDFLAMMAADFKLTEAVVASMAAKIRRLYRQLKNTPGAVRLDQQIAARIWKLARDYGVPTDKGMSIEFALTQALLADMVGAKRENVSRQLKRLSEKGLIIVEKKHFFVPDMAALANYMG